MSSIKIASIFLLSVVIIIGVFWLVQEIRDAPAIIIIAAFIKGEALNIKPGTEDYNQMMKGIMLGNYPELTGNNSSYIKNEHEMRIVMSYVGRNLHSGIEKFLRNRFQEPEVEEAPTPIPDK